MMLQSCLMNSLGKPHLWMVKASAVCGCNTLIETQHESDPVVLIHKRWDINPFSPPISIHHDWLFESLPATLLLHW